MILKIGQLIKLAYFNQSRITFSVQNDFGYMVNQVYNLIFMFFKYTPLSFSISRVPFFATGVIFKAIGDYFAHGDKSFAHWCNETKDAI